MAKSEKFGHEFAVAYPRFEQFVSAAPEVVAYLRRTEPRVELAHAANATWICLGYGLSHLPHSTESFGQQAAGPLDDAKREELAAMLESATQSGGTEKAGALPWKMMLSILFSALNEMLANIE